MASTDPEEEHSALVSNLPRQLDSHDPSIRFIHRSLRDFLHRYYVNEDVFIQLALNLLLLDIDCIGAETNSQKSRVFLPGGIALNLMRVHDYSKAPRVKFEVLERSKDDGFYRAFPCGNIRPKAQRPFEIQMYLLENMPRWLLMLAKSMLEAHQLTTESGKCYEVTTPIEEWVLSTTCLQEGPFTEEPHLFLSIQPWEHFERIKKIVYSSRIDASLPVEVEVLKDLWALGYLKSSSRPPTISDGLERQRDLVPKDYYYKHTRLYHLSSREERRWKGRYLSSQGMRIRWKVVFTELQKPVAFTWWARSLNARRYQFTVEYPANPSSIFVQREDNAQSLSTTHMKEMNTTGFRNKDDKGRALHVRLSLGESKLPPMSYNSRPLVLNADKRLRPIPASQYEMKNSNSVPESTPGITADSAGRKAPISGITNLRLEPLFATHRSRLDRLRLLVEARLGHHVDWFPLPEIDQRPDSATARLTWVYGGKTMSIYLNQHQVDRWQESTDAVESGEGLPTFRDSRSTSSNTSLTLANCWQSFRRGLSKVLSAFWQWKTIPRNSTAKAPAYNMTASTRKDSYFCVDNLWNSVATTSMHTVTSIDSLEDDRQLFIALRETLNCAQGGWWHRLSSWRTCTGLQLSKFTFLFDNSDLVKVPTKPINPKVEDICKGYEYLIQNQQMGLDEHMQIMAEIILQGIQVPDRGKGSKAVLQGIPKLRTPPGILKKQLNSGCGFYAIQGYCLMKILFWVGVMLSPGLAFILVWLSVVGALDLQNAFVPITFLSGMIAIVLGISMMLGV